MNLDKVISEKFTGAFMNDSKWDKVMEVLTDQFDEVFINYKLIHNEEISFISMDASDFKPYFIEPIFYKEVEWIEFPQSFVRTQNKRITRKFEKVYTQDLRAIEECLRSIGEFIIECDEKKLKLIAYR